MKQLPTSDGEYFNKSMWIPQINMLESHIFHAGAVYSEGTSSKYLPDKTNGGKACLQFTCSAM